MDQKSKLVFGTMFALFCGLCISNKAFGQALPDGKGKVEFIHNCTACHRADLVTRIPKTSDEWRKSVDEMAARGTDGSKEDLDNVVLYLVTNYGTEKSGSAAATQSIAPSSTLGGAAVLNSPEIERVKHVITENGCLTCHRIENRGAYTGPALNGLGAQRSSNEIRTAIVSPRHTLNPGNSLVQLTTSDGKKLTGRILSQDDHNVRVIDASGEIATYSKAELLQFTIVDTNPISSFEGKITGEDLDDLVRYLGSLPSVDESVQK
jgi:putative heme-binding domain-containing protein